MGKLIGIGDNRMDILAHVGWKPGDVTIDCSAISTFGKNMGGLLKHGPTVMNTRAATRESLKLHVRVQIATACSAACSVLTGVVI